MLAVKENTMEENKYLKLARQAREENNTEDAKTYYNKAREEDVENGEAKFFYAYYALYDGTNGELFTRFTNLCKAVLPSVKLVKESELSEEEKLKTIKDIVETFVPEVWVENRYMNKKNTEHRVDNQYVIVFSQSVVTATCETGLSTLKELGDGIDKLYPTDVNYKNIAVTAWKEYVTLAQKWYAYVPKGDAEIYAEKIKKYEPSYEMPKKEGCISFADKR